MDQGENVFEELESFEAEHKKQKSPNKTPKKKARPVASSFTSPPLPILPCPSQATSEDVLAVKETMMLPDDLPAVTKPSFPPAFNWNGISAFGLDKLHSLPTKEDLRLLQKKPALKKNSKIPISIKEATVVLALVELAEPVKFCST